MSGRKLDGATVVVIGGGSGIGLACAEAAREAGASVVIAGRSPEKLGRAKARIGADVRTLVADVTDEASVRDLFGRIERVDHLLVAAAETAAVGVVDAEGSDVRPTLEIRVWGGFFAAKHAAPAMDGGSITSCRARPPIGPIPARRWWRLPAAR